jgi:hypothetical protein
MTFNGLGMATEGTGAQYAADLGQGWKISPSQTFKMRALFSKSG